MASSLDITPMVPAGKQLIGGYGDGGFSIAGTRHVGAVMVLAEETLPWAVADANEITLESLAPILQERATLDIVLIGCGVAFLPPPKGLRAALREQGVALEWMDTGAACRTFNVLLAEGRPTAAALLPVDDTNLQ